LRKQAAQLLQLLLLLLILLLSVSVVQAQAGQIVLCEFMIDPLAAASSKLDGAYIELHNVSDDSIDILNQQALCHVCHERHCPTQELLLFCSSWTLHLP
jgi:hypothetical protein